MIRLFNIALALASWGVVIVIGILFYRGRPSAAAPRAAVIAGVDGMAPTGPVLAALFWMVIAAMVLGGACWWAGRRSKKP